MLIVSIQKKERINEFSLWFISILCIGVSAITLFMSGFIVDEYNLGGDSLSFDMFIGIVCISGLNFIIYYRRNKKAFRITLECLYHFDYFVFIQVPATPAATNCYYNEESVVFHLDTYVENISYK